MSGKETFRMSFCEYLCFSRNLISHRFYKSICKLNFALSNYSQKYLYLSEEFFTCELPAFNADLFQNYVFDALLKCLKDTLKLQPIFSQTVWFEISFCFKFYLGQRLVLYLAAADLMFSIPHPLDHIYSLFQIEVAYEVFCTIAAFILQVNFKI